MLHSISSSIQQFLALPRSSLSRDSFPRIAFLRTSFLHTALKSQLALLFVLGVSLVGCSQNQPTGTDTGADQEAATGTESTERQNSPNTVTVLGVFVGEQQARLEEAIAPFEAETGIDVIYEGTDAFTTLLPVRIDSGDPPDIAMFPQPGLMKSLAAEGALVPLDDFLSRAALNAYYPESWIDLSTVNNKIYGVWYRSAVKSLVWYVPAQFEKRGYDIPKTWEELTALSNQMIAAGETPWCIGLESGNASGWPATDWIEEILLRTAGPDFYEQWVNHEVPFDSPEVQTAFEYFGDIVRSPGSVWGGKTGALSISWGEAPTGLFAQEPKCFMHRQGNFIANFFPDDVVLGEDVTFFQTPDINPDYSNALLVGGDIFAMLQDTPAARKFMAYMASPTPHEIWAARGDFLSPNKQVDLGLYPNDITRQQAELLTSADVVQFDGSDAMPGAVGTGTFWTEAMNFVAGSSAKQVTEQIEYYWPAEIGE
ncbi:MAG: ABC transporter substrate-binding protein [Phormidesmis sp.]